MVRKITLAIGTRPEAIKMAPLIHVLRGRPQDFDVQVCVTGQHREMLDQALAVFGIKSDIDLNLMQKSQGLSGISAAV